MDEEIIAADLAIPGWVDYVRTQADSIEASFADLQTGKTAAGRFMGAAESIRQLAQHNVAQDTSIWTVSRILQSGSVTTDQLRDLWSKAKGDEDELKQLFDRLVSLGEIEV